MNKELGLLLELIGALGLLALGILLVFIGIKAYFSGLDKRHLAEKKKTLSAEDYIEYEKNYNNGVI